MAPTVPEHCDKCGQIVELERNRYRCKNPKCRRSIDIWENTPLAGFPSICWHRHYLLIYDCASNSTAKASAATHELNVNLVERVFNDFRVYCSKSLDKLQFKDGEEKFVAKTNSWQLTVNIIVENQHLE